MSKIKSAASKAERAVIRVLVSKDVRPLEYAFARKVATSVLIRVGAGSAVTALVYALVEKYLA